MPEDRGIDAALTRKSDVLRKLAKETMAVRKIQRHRVNFMWHVLCALCRSIENSIHRR
jgi:hypothetical protein